VARFHPRHRRGQQDHHHPPWPGRRRDLVSARRAGFSIQGPAGAELAIAFGGRVAEEIIFNRISTGASNDIKQATDLAQQMIRSWGMSETLGPLSFAKDEEQVFLGREIAQHRDYSEETARKIDAEVNVWSCAPTNGPNPY
jgi:hypothetical protein